MSNIISSQVSNSRLLASKIFELSHPRLIDYGPCTRIAYSSQALHINCISIVQSSATCLLPALKNLSKNSHTHTVQIYRDEDKPLYRKGNLGLIILVAYNMLLIIGVKLYYKYRNHTRKTIWDAMTAEEKAHYLDTTEDQGNKRYVSIFASFLSFRL